MKAEIDQHGVLTVTAETPLESYALDQWGSVHMCGIGEEAEKMSTGKFIIDGRFE